MHHVGDGVLSGEGQFRGVGGGIYESSDIVLLMENGDMYGCWRSIHGLVEQTQNMLVWLSERGCSGEELAGETLSGEEEPGRRGRVLDE